jgi:hypothetical protein
MRWPEPTSPTTPWRSCATAQIREVVVLGRRGPTGLIGNNKPDAAATVDAMLADLPALQRLRDNHRPRVKVTTVPEMMAVIREGR